jgi:hypothetical protein
MNEIKSGNSIVNKKKLWAEPVVTIIDLRTARNNHATGNDGHGAHTLHS